MSMSQIRLGVSKTYSVADGVSIKSRREDDDWGRFDENWGFRIHDVPPKFRTKLKKENYELAKIVEPVIQKWKKNYDENSTDVSSK